MSSLNENSEILTDKTDDTTRNTNDEITDTYEFVNGYDEQHNEEYSQKRKDLNISDNQQKDYLTQSTILREYVEITQDSLDENMKQTLTTTLKSMSEEFNEINDQNKKLQSENNKLKEDNDNLLKEKESVEQDFSKAKDYYESKIKSLELKLQNQTNAQKVCERTDLSLQNQLSDKKQENTINDDDDQLKQLKQDISDLQHTLEDYVTNLESEISINVKEMNILIKQYGCRKEISPEDLDKSFVKAVLQRKVLQQIFDFSKNYRKYKGGNISLESEIDSKTQELLDLIKKFSETRTESDEISKVATIKIRQQIYEILGNHGFSDIISSNNILTHNFINYSSRTLNEIMGQYRQINDIERKNEVEKLSPILIRDALRIFWFRLMAQEPIPEVKFFESNVKINQELMTGKWEGDEFDEMCVDLCYFPMIGKELDLSCKTIALAKILPCPILNANDEENGQNKIEDTSLVSRFLSLLK